MSIITLTTDFGSGSPYVAAMKGVILCINPAVTLVDVSHDVRPQDVHHGAVILDDVSERFPPDTIHVAVVDPGVGTDRDMVYARIGEQQYVAPDNGLLSRLAQRSEPDRIIRLAKREFWLDEVSSTFHGRDVMAPVAAQLSLGLDPARLGPPAKRLIGVEWPEVQVGRRRIDGTVLEIDSFGNLITNVTADHIAGLPCDERVCIVCNVYETWGIFAAYAHRPRGTLIALIGSTGRLELALVGDNAAKRLGIRIGTPVTVAWQ